MALTYTIGPDGGSSTSDRITSGDALHRLLLSGSATKGDTIRISYFDPATSTTRTLSTTVGSNGKWSLSTSTLADGSYQFNVVETNSKGSIVAQSTSASWTVDTQTNVSFSGTSLAGNAGAVSLTGAAEAFDTVKITYRAANGTQVTVGTATADASGKWSLSATLAAGSYTLTATATDKAGNIALASQSVTLYPLPSERVSAITVAGDNVVNQLESTQTAMPVRVVLTSALAGADKVIVTAGGTNYTATLDSSDPTGKTFVAVVPTAQVAGTISSHVENAVGGSSAILTQVFAVDTVAPAAPGVALGTGVAGGATAAEATQAGGVVTVVGEAGASISVTFTRGSATVTKSLTGTGTPTAVPLTTGDLALLGDGTIGVSAVAKDAAGNASLTTITSFVLDTAAPLPPVLQLGTGVPGGATAPEAIQPAGVVTVSAEVGAAIALTFTNGVATVTKSFTGTGSATAVQLTPDDLAVLGDGTISVSAVAKDAAGNTSGAGSASFVLDTAAPPTPSLQLGTGVPGGATAAEATQAGGVVTVSAEAGSTVGVAFTAGTATVTKALSGTGSATAVQLTAADIATLGDGTIAVSAVATDAAGNVSPAGSTSFVLDTAVPLAPTLQLGAGVSGGATATEAAQAGGVVTIMAEAGAAMALTFTNGGATVTKSGTGTGSATAVQLTPADLAALGDGTISVSAVATDGAGNASPGGSTSFVLDTTAPQTPNLVVRGDGGAPVTLSNDSTLYLTGSAEAGSTVTVTWNAPSGTPTLFSVTAGADGSWTLDTPTLGEGTHSFSATAQDAAGNVGAGSGATSVGVDTVAPSETVTSLVVASNNIVESTEAAQATVPVQIKLSAPLAAGETLVVTAGGTTYTAILDTSDATGKSWTATIATPAAPGSVSAQVRDAAGNAGVPAAQQFDVQAAAAPRWDHIVMVVDENHSYSEIIGNSQAPYINSLAAQGALFTNFNAALHPSQPNYIIMFSGSTQGVVDDDSHFFTAPTIAGQLQSAGFSFAGYAQSGAGTRHEPWLDFAESQNLTRDLSTFPTDFNQLPTLSYVVANDANNMHDGTISTGDSWLQAQLGTYATWAQTHNSLLIVTFDEGSWNTSDGNRIATVVFGAGIAPQLIAQPMDHYGLLHTIESIYGLPALADSAKTPVMDFAGLPALNNAPVSAGEAFYAGKNATLTVASGPGSLANDTDRDGDSLSAVLVSGPSHGALQLNGDGSFVYTPAADYTGPDAFTYRATDGKNPSAVATASLFVSATVPVHASFQQGAGGYSGVTDTMVRAAAPTTTYDKYSDLNVDTSTPTGSNYPAEALVQFANLFGSGPGQIPLGSTIVSATLTFTTTDVGSGGDLHRMLVPWTGTSTWNSLVNGVQADGTDALASIDAHIGPVVANGPVTADVTASLQSWSNGQANYGWALTPIWDDGWFFASAETAQGPQLSVVYVAPVGNRPPVQADDSYATTKDTVLNVASSAGVLVNDKDFDGNALTAQLVSGPAHGSLQLNADGSFSYAPQAGYLGTDSFTYVANDGQAVSGAGTVNLAVGTLTDHTITLQQGKNGYTGTADTMLRQDSPTSRAGTTTVLNLDTDDPNGTGHWSEALLRFDNLFGTGASQVPLGAHILSATLTLQTTDTGDGGELHRMLQSWSANDATWNTMVNGIQADGIEAAAQIAASTGRVGSLGATPIDVTGSVQSWADGAANYGWAMLPLGTDGWRFASSEQASAPQLTVHYEIYV